MERKATKRQVQKMCADFLRARSGSIYEAIQAASAMLREWGVRVDWHEMSDALDAMESRGEASRSSYGADGLVEYVIN